MTIEKTVSKTAQKPKIRKATVRGIAVEIPENMFKDFEFFEMIYDIDNGQIQQIVPFFRKFFPAEVYQEIKESLRDENGHLDVQDMAGFLTELLIKLAPKSQNSSQSGKLTPRK